MIDAGRIQARLRALSIRERLLLLLCVASLLVFTVIRSVVYPRLDEYRRTRALVPQRAATLARYQLAAEGKDNVADRFVEVAERLEEMEDVLLPGDSPSASGAFLQGLLKPMLEQKDTRVTSVRGLAPVSKGESYAEVSVQVDLQTTTEGLATILSAITRHPKVLRVKKLSVSSGYFGPSAAARRETLAVSVVVSGMARATGEEKPQGRAGEHEG